MLIAMTGIAWAGMILVLGLMWAAFGGRPTLNRRGALGGQTPVTFVWSQSIAAGATFNPLTDWQYETPQFQGMIEVFSRATAVGLVETISSAGDTLKQEAPVQAGGTAGTTPSRLNTEAVVGRALSGQKIRIGYRNPTGGAITVDGIIILTPTGGGGGGGGGRRRAPPPPRRRRR